MPRRVELMLAALGLIAISPLLTLIALLFKVIGASPMLFR